MADKKISPKTMESILSNDIIKARRFSSPTEFKPKFPLILTVSGGIPDTNPITKKSETSSDTFSKQTVQL